METLICLHCGATFERKAKTGPVPKYCSTSCRGKENKKIAPWDKSPRKCKTCGGEYTPVKRKQIFCCLACNQKGKVAEREPKKASPVECSACGVVYTPKRSTGRTPFCSAKCQKDTHRKTPGAIATKRKNDRIKNHVRRARILGATIESVDLAAIYARDRWTCGLCGGQIDPDAKWPDPSSPSIDHITPLSKGGSHTPANLQAAHLSCNVGKGNRG